MGAIQKTFAVGALLAAASGAWAATATASLSNVQIQVFDLTPDDGIAPSFTLLSDGTRYNYASASTESGLSQWVYDTTPVSAHLSPSGLALVGSATGTPGSLASFSATSSLSDTALSTYGDVQAYGQISFGLEVGAGTLVFVTANSEVSANAAGIVPGTYLYGYTYISFYSGVDGISVGSSGYLQAWTGSTYSNASPSSSGHVSASYANFGSAATLLNVNASAQTGLQTPLAPVPEPSSTAMLLSGLGVAFGLAYRRRERRA